MAPQAGSSRLLYWTKPNRAQMGAYLNVRSSADSGFLRSLINPRVRLPLPPPGGAAEQQHFPEVRAIHERADYQKHRAGENTDRPPAPRVAADQGRRRAKGAQGDQGLAAFVRDGADSPAPLAEGGNAARLPGVEQYRQPDEADQHPEQ